MGGSLLSTREVQIRHLGRSGCYTCSMLSGILLGIVSWLLLRCVPFGLYVIDQNERGVMTVFGRAKRVGDHTTHDIETLGSTLTDDEKLRYQYPVLKVIPPGGPYFKFPWEKVHKVSIATQLVPIAFDPEYPSVNHGNTVLEAVTRDQLNIGLQGQLRYTVSENNLYAYLFGVKNPIAHVMGYFVSILRERVANFEDTKAGLVPAENASVMVGTQGISINDLRKNLGELNDQMAKECVSSAARYGITLDAALITAIEPPEDIESALAAINTTHNEVSSDISLAEASASQKVVQSKRAVEIETLKAQAEVQVLRQLAEQLLDLKNGKQGTLAAYVRNVRLSLISRAKNMIITKHD